jgi:hypothetical protein
VVSPRAPYLLSPDPLCLSFLVSSLCQPPEALETLWAWQEINIASIIRDGCCSLPVPRRFTDGTDRLIVSTVFMTKCTRSFSGTQSRRSIDDRSVLPRFTFAIRSATHGAYHKPVGRR